MKVIKMKNKQNNNKRAWIEINLKNLEHNVEEIRKK